MKVGECYLGHARDEALRARGASGGLVTAVLARALESGLVDGVIVLKKLGKFEAVPVITDRVEDVLESAGSMHTVPANFAKLAASARGLRLAMPAKPCDARGIIEQGKRNALNLDETYIVGLNCGGSLHPVETRRMLQEVYKLDPDQVEGEEIEKGKLIFKTRDGEAAISIDELEEKGFGRRPNCRYCPVKIPRNADLACGNWGAKPGETFVEITSQKGVKLLENALDAIELTPAPEGSIKVREKIRGVMENLSGRWLEKSFPKLDGRLEFYTHALENCIDCGACKKVCPVCSCGESSKCVDFHQPVDGYKLSLYHLIRFLHIADSCIGCGQCSDVCPAEIPLAELHQRFARPLQMEFKYLPGMDLRRPPYFEVKLE